ncbi:MAG TPA: homoserine dehydrogenase [Gammaproteobacteria bacterium]
MNTVTKVAPDPGSPRILDVVLLGVGTVGSEFLRRISASPPPGIRLAGIANSRRMLFEKRGIAAGSALDRLRESGSENCLDKLTASLRKPRGSAPVIVDATASVAVAERHAAWRAAGIHIVTANKIAAANGWLRGAGAFYGDAATVGAGLPVLGAIRRLRAAGDVITRIEGILSGSLGFVFHALQRHGSFSRAVRDARSGGLTEPDPRVDLAGLDVARKLAIIAGAAGLQRPNLQPESLIASADNVLPLDAFLLSLPDHDAGWRERVDDARARGGVLRYVASVDCQGDGFVGVRELHADAPLAQTRGADNGVAIYSHAYDREPLFIRGPGAGAAVTATALLADLSEIAARIRW